MQDIGGCRAILSSDKRVTKLVRELKRRRPFRISNYLKNPKPDGYRGVHLVGDFSSGGGQRRSIEIQIRTRIQHSWATAVEIIDLFTGQAIKSNDGEAEWQEFFQVASELFAVVDQAILRDESNQGKLAALVADKVKKGGQGSNGRPLLELNERVYSLSNKLDVITRFNAFTKSLKFADEQLAERPADGYVLLEVDVNRSHLNCGFFRANDFDRAASKYLEAEKKAAATTGISVALVATDAVGGLKEAYPNYFADSEVFLKLIFAIKSAYLIQHPSGISRTIKKLLG